MLFRSGGFLNNGRHIDPVIFLFSKLVQVRGIVRPISSEYMHLAATLENGKTVVGQHLLTGREVDPISSPVKELFLTKRIRRPQHAVLPMREKIRRLIASADLICYPVGSFYTSVVANLLVRGVGDVVASLNVPKVYVPNSSVDVEELGLDLASKVETLLYYLHKSCEKKQKGRDLLSHVVLDTENGNISLAQVKAIRALGVDVVDLPLASPSSAPLLDPQRIAETLISLA